MIKVLIYTSLLFVIIIAILLNYNKLPAVFEISSFKNISKREQQIQIGDTINPFHDFDFDKGSWEAIVFFSSSDIESLPSDIPKYSCLYTTKKALLKEIQKNWKFIYSGGDLATVTSSFYILQNGKIVFESGLVFENQLQGFQNSNYGWSGIANKHDMSIELKDFEKELLLLRFL